MLIFLARIAAKLQKNPALTLGRCPVSLFHSSTCRTNRRSGQSTWKHWAFRRAGTGDAAEGLLEANSVFNTKLCVPEFDARARNHSSV